MSTFFADLKLDYPKRNYDQQREGARQHMESALQQRQVAARVEYIAENLDGRLRIVCEGEVSQEMIQACANECPIISKIESEADQGDQLIMPAEISDIDPFSPEGIRLR